MAKRRRTTKIPLKGPLTLEQAQLLAKVKYPPPRGTANEDAAVRLTRLAIERRRLKLAQEKDNRRRVREYKDTLKILKKRGVRGLGDATPLQLFAEGDSWFKYPVPFFGGGIIPRLQKRLGIPILNLAKAGDEVRFMLGVDERKELIKQLKRGCPAGGPWDALLFSGGGNDVVDDPMVLWVKEYDGTRGPEDQIDHERFETALQLVRYGYEDLIALRDHLSEGTHLFFHAYDFAIPDGRGKCFLGPWLKPTFDLRGFPSVSAAFETMKLMLQEFDYLLQSLEREHDRVTFVRTQGTLEPRTDSWDNELHPEKAGFNRFADIFRDKIEEVFPTRLLTRNAKRQGRRLGD
jgi:hypothetical protein